jgi:hypothetical protein
MEERHEEELCMEEADIHESREEEKVPSPSVQIHLGKKHFKEQPYDNSRLF